MNHLLVSVFKCDILMLLSNDSKLNRFGFWALGQIKTRHLKTALILYINRSEKQ